jgi:hypothetical protein
MRDKVRVGQTADPSQEDVFVSRAGDAVELALHPTDEVARALGRLEATGLSQLFQDYWQSEQGRDTPPGVMLAALCVHSASIIGSVLIQTTKPGREKGAEAAAAKMFAFQLASFMTYVGPEARRKGWL